MKRTVVTVAALLPLAVEAAVKLVLRPRPFWVHFYDPEVIYFLQGLRMLRGQVPSNIDHPGTPLQVLSALVAAMTGSSLLRYDAFVSTVHVLMFVGHAAAVVLLLATVLRELPPMMQVVAIWTYLLAPGALERLDVWSPEGLYLLLGAIALAMLWRWRNAPSPRNALLAGVVIGICVATKLLLLAWAGAAVAAMLASRRVRDASVLGIGLVLGFAAGTLPIASEWVRMVSRIAILRTLDPQEQAWGTLLVTAKMWIAWMAVVIALLVLQRRRVRWPLAIFGLTSIALICFGVRHNPSFHYLLPWALGVMAVLVAASDGVPRRLQIALLIICAVLLGRGLANDLGAHHRRIDDAERIQAQIAAIVGESVTVYSWRVPHPSFALHVMAEDPRDHAEVARRYPRDAVFTWQRQVLLPPGVVAWDYLVITPERLREFRDPVGPQVGTAGPFLILKRP